MAGITWWTENRIERLRQLAAEGLSAREIARRLSTRTHRATVEAVRGAARRFGVRLRARGGAPIGNRNAARARTTRAS